MNFCMQFQSHFFHRLSIIHLHRKVSISAHLANSLDVSLWNVNSAEWSHVWIHFNFHVYNYCFCFRCMYSVEKVSSLCFIVFIFKYIYKYLHKLLFWARFYLNLIRTRGGGPLDFKWDVQDLRSSKSCKYTVNILFSNWKGASHDDLGWNLWFLACTYPSMSRNMPVWHICPSPVLPWCWLKVQASSPDRVNTTCLLLIKCFIS